MSSELRDTKQIFIIFFHLFKCTFYCYSLFYLIDFFYPNLDIWGYRSDLNTFIFFFTLIFGPTSYFYIDYFLSKNKKKWKEKIKMRWKLLGKYYSE